jgi:hypothetical protein
VNLYKVTVKTAGGQEISEYVEGKSKDHVRSRIKNAIFRSDAVIEKVPSELDIDPKTGQFHLIPRKGKRR